MYSKRKVMQVKKILLSPCDLKKLKLCHVFVRFCRFSGIDLLKYTVLPHRQKLVACLISQISAKSLHPTLQYRLAINGKIVYRCQTSALYAVTPYAKQPNCCGLTLAYLTAHCFPQTLRWLHCHLVSNSSLCGPSGALAQGYWGLNLLAWRVLMTVFENVALFDWSINQKRNPPLKKKKIYIYT